MIAFTNKNKGSSNTKSELYSGGSYLGIMSDRTCEVYEPDIYSDVSFDTSSHDDSWYAWKVNQTNSSRSDMNHTPESNYIHLGSTYIGDEELGRFPWLYNSSWYSDDEMCELLSFDESNFLTQEELRYLTELEYRDIGITECFDECHDDTKWGNLHADFFLFTKIDSRGYF